MAAASNEIAHDLYPFIRVYKDGRVERFSGEDLVPASVDPDTGVQSKDVEFAPQQKLSARLYLPKSATPAHKLPVLVYFHGGGFVFESAFSSLYHRHLNLLVAETNVVAVSVDYRVAPEYPLPIAYEDSWLAVKWVASHRQHLKGDTNNHEVWLKDYVDFDRFYLGGDSAGANIAHNIAMRCSEKSDAINISGIFMNCPYFWGKERIGNEAGDLYPEAFITPDYIYRLWHFAHPASSGLDDPMLNPAMDPKISSLACKRILVFVAGRDTLKYRGWWYKDVLIKSGWVGDVEVLEIEGEEHVFDLFKFNSEKAISTRKKLASFISSYSS